MAGWGRCFVQYHLPRAYTNYALAKSHAYDHLSPILWNDHRPDAQLALTQLVFKNTAKTWHFS